MGDDVATLLIALARENAALREQLATAQGMVMKTAVDAGNLYERLEAVQIECDASRGRAGAGTPCAASLIPRHAIQRSSTEAEPLERGSASVDGRASPCPWSPLAGRKWTARRCKIAIGTR